MTTKVVDWFLEHQDEARAYRVTKVKIPRLGYTLYRDSIQRSEKVRHVHICSAELFQGDLEEHRVKEPFVGLDMVMVHGEMRIEAVLKVIGMLRKMDKRRLELTIDLTLGAAHYNGKWLENAVSGFYQYCEMRNIKLTLTTTQFHPIDMDVHEAIAKRNASIVGINKEHGSYTPYLHRATMRAKKGMMRHRLGLWEKATDGQEMLKMGRAGYVLYLRFLKAFHQQGFEMAVDGVCNPETKTKRQTETVSIDGVFCGVSVIRPRQDWQVDEFWEMVRDRRTSLKGKIDMEELVEKAKRKREASEGRQKVCTCKEAKKIEA